MGSAREFSFCPLSPVTVLCLMSRLHMCPRAGFQEVMGSGSKGEQPRFGAGPLGALELCPASLQTEFSHSQIPRFSISLCLFCL